MRSPITYYGGKQKLAKKIIAHFPRHSSYVEPFAGGAACLFAKPVPPVTDCATYQEILNDLDGQVINFYKIIQDPVAFEEFHRKLYIPYSKQVFEESVVRLREPPDGVDSAVALFVKLHQGFNSSLSTRGWRRSRGSGLRNPAVSYQRKIDILVEFTERMRNIHLDCIPATQCIKAWDGPGVLHYCDPPYVGAEQGYKYKFNEQDLIELCDTLASAKGSFVLSGYSHPVVDAYGWDKVTFDVQCSSQKKDPTARRTDCIWIVDRSNDATEKIKKAWQRWEAKGFNWGKDH